MRFDGAGCSNVTDPAINSQDRTPEFNNKEEEGGGVVHMYADEAQPQQISLEASVDAIDI